MLADGDKPRIGVEFGMLGARTPPNPLVDIPVDSAGMVHSGTGGISVAPELKNLPMLLIPARLKHLFPKARGNDELVCWRWGDGSFKGSAVSPGLVFRPDPKKPNKHGFVEPANSMLIDQYQQALAETQDQWVRDEQ